MAPYLEIDQVGPRLFNFDCPSTLQVVKRDKFWFI